jgi:hypothetical protein
MVVLALVLAIALPVSVALVLQAQQRGLLGRFSPRERVARVKGRRPPAAGVAALVIAALALALLAYSVLRTVLP